MYFRDFSYQIPLVVLFLIVFILPLQLGAQQTIGQVVEMKVGEEYLLVKSNPDQQFYTLTPIDSAYEQGPYERALIGYRLIQLSQSEIQDSLIYSAEKAGTYYVGMGHLSSPDTLIYLKDILAQPIHQFVVREDDTYLGYLTELVNVPFGLVPWRFGKNSVHQTDMRVLVDCAELAIYGRRRMGQEIPYVGPRGIWKYMEELPFDQLRPGDIIHFGDQVSVLYEDVNPIGKLNAEDILIQAFEERVRKVSWKESGFYGRPYKPLRWK
ncbi:MAG: hypothetical protein AAFY71_24795 [Bacteroidota bacterium]